MFNNKEGYLKEMHCFVSRDAFFQVFSLLQIYAFLNFESSCIVLRTDLQLADWVPCAEGSPCGK